MASKNYSKEPYPCNLSNDGYNIKTDITHEQINEVFNNLSCQEQIYDFYEALRNSPNGSVEQFQAILEVFVCDVLKYRKEIKRLEDSFKREKETNEKYLRTIEEDQERDMRDLEEKIRNEERQKFEMERDGIQQRASKEINDLKTNIQHLRIIEKQYINRKNEEDSSVNSLLAEISKLTEENTTLSASLNETLTANAILQSDLQSYKAQLNERQTMLLQEKQSASSKSREKESLQTNVRHLVEVNKQLRDENDSLRALIDKTNKLSAANALPSPHSLLSTPSSNLGSYWHDSKLDSPSPSYMVSKAQRKFDRFDIESADEIGILANETRAVEKLAVTKSLNEAATLKAVPIITKVGYDSNTMNDSGLSLTTVRDATELDSDQDSYVTKQITTKNIKQHRTLIHKANDNDDTDSDSVFTEISLDRVQSKRPSLQKAPRRPVNNTRSTGKQATNSSQTITQSPSLINSAQRNDNQNLAFDRLFKVVFCGDAAVGKSTLIVRICKGQFVSSLNSTLGVDFQNKQINVDGKRIALQLWDTAGQERFRSVARSYFRRCDGVVLVYDATYERSFLNVRDWVNIIMDSTPKKVSIMIVGNKIDLRGQARTEGKRVIDHNEGAKLAKECNALFIETSAKDGTNSEESLVELARDMECNEDLERIRTRGIDLDKVSKKSTCCGTRF